MTWQEAESKIRSGIRPGDKGILKCRGNDRRLVVSNNGKEIAVRTGVKTENAKLISYEMIKYAFEKIAAGEVFDSAYFQKRYLKEYNDGPCRYSAVGGILVEIGDVERIPFGVNSCVYRKKR